MPSLFDAVWNAAAIPELVSRFGYATSYQTPDGFSLISAHILEHFGQSALDLLAERTITVETADATVEVAASEVTPIIGGFFTLSDGNLYAVVAPPQLRAGLWLCACRRRAPRAYAERYQESKG